MAEIAQYSSEEEGGLNEPREKKSRGQNVIYSFDVTLESEEEALAQIREEECWSKNNTGKSVEGQKIYYRCNAVPWRKGVECPAKLYLLYHSDSFRVSIFRSESEHEHSELSGRGIPPEIRAQINDMYDENVTKPKQILATLARRGLEQPTAKQLKNYLSRLRKEKFGSASMSMTELSAWCEGLAQAPPSPDDVFVEDYELEILADEEIPLIRIFITTERLLLLAAESKLCQIDATYKLVWNGFPILMVGTSDSDRVFHPFGLSLTSRETAEDFKFILESLKKGVLRASGSEFAPEYLMADGADSITKAAHEIFGETLTRLMCFFHVKKRLKGNKSFKGSKKAYSELLRDVDTLQLASSPALFECGYALFKDTFRERLPLSQFLPIFSGAVKEWSVERDPSNPNFKPFASGAPTKTLKTWTETYQWLAKKVPGLQFQDGQTISLYFPSAGEEKNFTSESLKKHREKEGDLEFEDFSAYRKFTTEVWKVEFKAEGGEGKCSCPVFLKTYACKHSLGGGVRLKRLSVPDEAKTVPIGQKRSRGRPSKAKSALIVVD